MTKIKRAKRENLDWFLKKVFLAGALIAALFLFSFLVSAQSYSRSFVGYSPYTEINPSFGDVSFGGGFLSDRSKCSAGQDFILHVSPLGCVPSVVRSDLLEQQNVPVFCPIVATQLNPLISVETIDSLSFGKESVPGEVSGVGYYPAQAALGKKEFSSQPVLSNIGYAVIVLKKQRNESSMPNFVEGNLSARIRYDIKNAFGVGNAGPFYLPLMSDEEWNNNFKSYGFWQGRGYLRAESVEDDRTIISVYSDRSSGLAKTENRVVATAPLQIRETSREIFVPGFDYCTGSLELKLNGVEAPDTTARLKINGDYSEFQKGSVFLDNKCRVQKIDKKGVVQSVSIHCKEDDRGNSFVLSISPRINLIIEGVSGVYGVGGKLYISEDEKKTVFLAYLTKKENADSEENLIATFISIPGVEKEKLTDEELISIAGFLNRAKGGEVNNLISLGAKGLKFFSSGLEKTFRGIVVGENFNSVSFGEEENVFGKNVKFVGFAGARDEDISKSSEILENYENSMKEYNSVLESFSSEKYPSEEQISLGQQALIKKIELSWNLNQKKSALEFCDYFREKYPRDDVPELCEDVEELSSSSVNLQGVLINGRVYTLSLDRIKEPGFEEFGAVISVKMPDGSSRNFDLTKNERIVLNETRGDFIELVDIEKNLLDEEFVGIVLNLKTSGIAEKAEQFLSSSKKILKKGFPESYGSDYLFTLEKTNLKKVAKVSVHANINRQYTEAKFPFKIGIEKRAIQLSPEKTRERIEVLNSTISKWKDINDNIGNVVRAGKAACFATGTYLSIKNFFENVDGKGIAREKVMRGRGGWFEFCEREVSERRALSVDACLIANSDTIESSVENVAGIMKEQNENFKELQKEIAGKDFLGENFVDTEELMNRYISQNYKNNLSTALTRAGLNEITIGGKAIAYSEIVDSMNSNTTLITEAREIEMYSKLLNSDDDIVKNSAKESLKKILGDVWANSEQEIDRQKLREEFNVEVGLFSSRELKKILVTNVPVFKDVETKFGNIIGSDGIGDNELVYIVKDRADGRKWLIVLGNDYVPKETYIIDDANNLVKDENVNPLGISIKKFDSSSYENKCINCVLSYYENGEYKGIPAIVPFSPRARGLGEGWYAAIKQVVPIGGAIKPVDDSGRVSSFWVCNVGKNGREEFNLVMGSGKGDDICEMINRATGQPYNQFPGLEQDKASRLVQEAQNAIADAQRGYKSGAKEINILGKIVKVGEPAIGVPGIKCQDFMSPKECIILFNVCDPFICPSSRCDLGGTYPVKDVVQSGVAGSIALCLPNAQEGILVPICVSGVHAGIDGYLSVLESYQDCLGTSLETGEQVGICDKLNSVYMCEFFWKQSLPAVKYTIPFVLSKIVSQKTRGGGEYLGFQDAWERAGNSMNYFTQYYATESYKAFKARTIEGVGTEVCRNWISVPGFQGGAFFDALTAPDSPPQFFGNFDEIQFTTITTPATSQYKVFYHIYSGKDFPAYYEVYLKGDFSAFYQDVPFRRVVARGFIPAGERKSETIDFTAPSGYREMCIVVNNQEECGFKQVTTDFAFQYLSDKYVQQQLNQSNIRTISECISGTTNAYNLLNLNIQSGVEEFIDPAIYNKGVVRICSTENPGKTTDSYIGTENQRWVEVGYCDSPSVKCWIDKQSVEDAIKITGVENQAISDIEQNVFETLSKNLGLFSNKEFDNFVEDVDTFVADEVPLPVSELNKRKIAMINNNFEKAFYSNQRGYLILLRGNLYKEIAEVLWGKRLEELKISQTYLEDDGGLHIGAEEVLVGVGDLTGGREFVERIENEKRNIQLEEEGSVLLFDDGRLLFGQNIYFSFSGENWYWCLKDCYDKNKKSSNWWLSGQAIYSGEFIGEGNTRVEVFPGMPRLNKENKKFILDELVGKNKLEGTLNLFDRVINNKEKAILGLGNSKLISENVDMTSKKLFGISRNNVYSIYFKFEDNRVWKWSYDLINWMLSSEMFVKGGKYKGYGTGQYENLVKSLENKNFNDGALIIFGIKEQITTEEPQLQDGATCPADVREILPEFSKEVVNIPDLNQRVLNAARELEGKSISERNLNCFDSIEKIFEKARVGFGCVYSDEYGKSYTLSSGNKQVKIGADKNNTDGESYFQSATNGRTCEFNPGSLSSYEQKLDKLVPGYEIDIVYNENSGHSVIFSGWVNRANKRALIFDWLGPEEKGGRVYAFREISLAENVHPVYFIRKPILETSSSGQAEGVSGE